MKHNLVNLAHLTHSEINCYQLKIFTDLLTVSPQLIRHDSSLKAHVESARFNTK